MKRFWLKITGLTIFVLASIIGVYILWPAKSQDVRQIPQQDASTSTIQPKTETSQPKRQLTPDDFQPTATSRLQDQNPRQQQLRERAAMLSSIYRNPDSPNAAKARRIEIRESIKRTSILRLHSGLAGQAMLRTGSLAMMVN